jgi:hypothetical protein
MENDWNDALDKNENDFWLALEDMVELYPHLTRQELTDIYDDQ